MGVHITHRGRLLRHYPLGGYNCRMGTLWEIDIPRHGLGFQFHCSVSGQVGKPHTFHSSNWVLSGYRREEFCILHMLLPGVSSFWEMKSDDYLLQGDKFESVTGLAFWTVIDACIDIGNTFREHVISSKISLAYCWRHRNCIFFSTFYWYWHLGLGGLGLGISWIWLFENFASDFSTWVLVVSRTFFISASSSQNCSAEAIECSRDHLD